MTRHDRIVEANASLADVEAWAVTNNEARDAIYELRKVPARLDMIDDDLGLIPADLAHFDAVIADTSYAVVSRAKNLKAARRRANSRLRALLVRYHLATALMPPRRGQDDWSALIDGVAALEGFKERGALLPTGASRPLVVLRARCASGPADVTQDDLEDVFNAAPPEVRKSIRKGIKRLNELIAGVGQWPHLRPFLPSVGFVTPKSPDRARRIRWQDLPQDLRDSAEGAFARCTRKPEDEAAAVQARLAAGEAPATVLAEVNDSASDRRRRPGNVSSALAGYRQSVTWLFRAHQDSAQETVQPADLRALFTHGTMSAACEDQVARSRNSLTLKAPDRSQTLSARLKNLRTIALHGLKDSSCAALVDLMRIAYHEYVVDPGKDFSPEALRIARMLRDKPHLAATFVNAPEIIAKKATADLEAARVHGNPITEERALRLYATAALYAVQVSRPVRTSNLIRLRLRSTPTLGGNIRWVAPRGHAEIRYLRSELKNDAEVTMQVLDADAAILWRWVHELRPRFIDLRDLPDSPYLVPGEASPRLVKDTIVFPRGCVSPSTMAEMWAQADAHLGLGISPHHCRHAIATLILALEPGAYAKVASILGDTEETVKKHYGRDSGNAAAVEIRKSILAAHPGVFNALRRSRWR